jgi:SAM-dependent methyltransferase
MKTIEESIVHSLDGTSRDIYPFLFYILQDLWEIGSDPRVIAELVRKHCNNYSALKILDLGCGKGAVSVYLAKEFGCLCTGIDAFGDFIEVAVAKAYEYGVAGNCRFEVGDIRMGISHPEKYDVIILGAIGPVLGTYFDTMEFLKELISNNGIIIIDDCYIDDHPDLIQTCIKKSEILEEIRITGMKLIDEALPEKGEIKDSNDFIFENIKNRCNELKGLYPDKSFLFDDYIRNQKEENDILEDKVISSVMVFKSLHL